MAETEAQRAARRRNLTKGNPKSYSRQDADGAAEDAPPTAEGAAEKPPRAAEGAAEGAPRAKPRKTVEKPPPIAPRRRGSGRGRPTAAAENGRGNAEKPPRAAEGRSAPEEPVAAEGAAEGGRGRGGLAGILDSVGLRL